MTDEPSTEMDKRARSFAFAKRFAFNGPSRNFAFAKRSSDFDDAENEFMEKRARSFAFAKRALRPFAFAKRSPYSSFA